MNFLDFLIFAFVGIFIIQGYRKGFIISLATFIALILGIYLAVNFSNFLDGILLKNLKPSRTWLPILSFTLTFLIVVTGVFVVAKLMEKVVNVVGMGFLNCLAGAILGFIKGVVLASILLFIITSVDTGEKWIQKEDKTASFIYHHVTGVFPALMKRFGGSIKFPGTAVILQETDHETR